MDDQQVTQFELGWLSGIIDGEGCFSMSPGSKGSYNVGIKIVNTNKIIVDNICDILKRLGIPFHIYDSHRSSNQRPAKRVEINGPKRVQRAMSILLDYIVAKKEEAILLSDYVNLRLTTPYGELDPAYSLATYQMLRALKR